MQIPPKETATQELNIHNLMALTARLAQVLAQEADLLAEMKIKEIEPLQKEKVTIAKAMELQLKRIQKNPHLLDSVHPEDMAEFAELAAIFDDIKQENYKRLMAAREVNQRIVEAITEVVNEQNKKPTYTEEGVNGAQYDSLSVTLNKKV
jgi:ABC-type Zn uptake system ZnuABC Zn-binding protein ZnuA